MRRIIRLSHINLNVLIRLLTILVCLVTIGFALILVLKEWKPFWVDEWRIIYNLKTKSVPQLWGQLDYMQQFPRAYLTLIKWFCAALHYSYFSLRFPSFLVGTMAIIFAWKLMADLYPKGMRYRYLFVLLFVCGFAFIGYYVQIKQYTMDMLLSLVAIWQAFTIYKIPSWNLTRLKYFIFCAISTAIPFFSYTYPLCIAPCYVIVALQTTSILKSECTNKRSLIFRQWLPLLLIGLSTVIFFLLDIKQVMYDGGMRMFWGHLMFNDGYSVEGFARGGFKLFGEILFPSAAAYVVAGLATLAFFAGIAKLIRKRKTMNEDGLYPLLYSVLLIITLLALFLAKKFPLGESRLNAFAIPAVAIMIISLLQSIDDFLSKPFVGRLLTIPLICGIIYTAAAAYLNIYKDKNYGKKLSIYRATEKALRDARASELPIMITPEVAFPYNSTRNFPYYDAIPGDWVLKTFPAYDMHKHLTVYNIERKESATELIKSLPDSIGRVMIGDGLSYRILVR